MIKRLLFVFLAVADSVLTLPLFPSSTANAATALSACSDTIDIGAYSSRIAAQDPGFDPVTYSYVVLPFSGSSAPHTGFYVLIQSGANKIVLQKDATYDIYEAALNHSDPGYAYMNIQTTAGYDYQVQSTGIGTLGTVFGLNNSPCMMFAHNVIYAPSYTDPHYTFDAPTDPTSYETCDALDFACYYRNALTFFGVVGIFISTFFTNIGTMFTNLSLDLVDGITSLLIPTTGHFGDMFSTLSTFFQTKFGFLSYPFTFFPNLFSALSSYDNIDSCLYGAGGGIGEPTTCTPNLGTFYGSTVTIDFGALERSFPGLWTLIRTFITGVTVFTLALAFRRKYMQIVKS